MPRARYRQGETDVLGALFACWLHVRQFWFNSRQADRSYLATPKAENTGSGTTAIAPSGAWAPYPSPGKVGACEMSRPVSAIASGVRRAPPVEHDRARETCH